MKSKLKKYMIINFGLIIMAIGLYFFLMPANLAAGGVSGLAMVIKNYLPWVNIGILMAGFNIILFVLALIVIGKEFGGNSIYSSFVLSGIIGILEILVPVNKPIIDDLLMNLIFGIVIQGIGMAIIFYQNSSTGGTDIIAKIINKFTHLEIGKALFLADALITVLAGIAFGTTLGFYAFFGILINGIVIDKVIAGINTKIHVMIISQNPEIINKFIHGELERGTTFLFGAGGYSNNNKQIISAVLARKEYMSLKHFVKENDPTAFIIMNFVHEVLGEGFDLTLQG